MKTFLTLLFSSILCLAQDPPPGYYDTAIGLTGETLRQELYAIINQHTVVSYKNTEAALKVLDQDPKNFDNVLLLYAQRSEPKANFGTTDGWNREHLWPNSLGLDDSGPEYSDLFNLRAEDATVNSARGNKYFDYSDPDNPSYRMPAHAEAGFSTSTDSDSWQPPQHMLGDIARAMFYMDVCYAGRKSEPDLVLTSYVDDISSKAAYMGRLSTLLQWHIDDPVSPEEQLRNGVIFSLYQHNRNPFVDHPEWVKEVFWPRLRWAVQRFPDNRPALDFMWDRVHAGARLEFSRDFTGWFLLPGLPAEVGDGSFNQYEFPSQCDFDNCNQFYRLNLRPNVIIKP